MAKKKSGKRLSKWDKAAKKEFDDMDEDWRADWADLRHRVMDRH
jgi:hypothetical protein